MIQSDSILYLVYLCRRIISISFYTHRNSCCLYLKVILYKRFLLFSLTRFYESSPRHHLICATTYTTEDMWTMHKPQVSYAIENTIHRITHTLSTRNNLFTFYLLPLRYQRLL